MTTSDEPSLWQRYRWLILVTTAFAVTGVVYARIYFPGFSWFETVVGGAAFGCFCSMCAASSRLFD